MTEEELKRIESEANSARSGVHNISYWLNFTNQLIEEVKLLRSAFADSMLDTDAVAEAKRAAFKLGQEEMRERAASNCDITSFSYLGDIYVNEKLVKIIRSLSIKESL